MDTIECKHCGGQMEVTCKSRYNQGFAFSLIILGIVSIFFIFGAPFGLLLLIIGMYMCCTKESIWLCGSCKTAISRVDMCS